MRLAKKKEYEGGFTLVELLVVMSIIAVLATIAITQFPPYRARGTRGSMVSDARNVAIALEAYFTEGATYAPADLLTVTGPNAFGAATALPGLRASKGNTVLIRSVTADYTISVTNIGANASGYTGPLLLFGDGSCRWTSGQNC